jgi:hypothetical protein
MVRGAKISVLNAMLDRQCLHYFRMERAFLLIAFLSSLILAVMVCWMLTHWRFWHWHWSIE